MLVIEGIGISTFTLQVTDFAGNSINADGNGIYFGTAFFGFTSSNGIKQIKFMRTTGGGLVLSSVFFSTQETDATPPSITAPPNKTIECASPTGTLVTDLGTSVVFDNITPTSDIQVTNNAPVTFPLGTTTVTWNAMDTSGNSAFANQRVTVVDTKAPNITAPPNVMVIANTRGGAIVDIGTATASDICDSSLTITSDAPNVFPLGDTIVTWTATDDSGNSATATQTVTVKPLPISIDIKPGSFPNSINPNSKGVIPVAILTTSNFDTSTVDASTVKFGSAQAVKSSIEDVDNDGDLDMILHFNTETTGIACGQTSAILTGQTLDGIPIEGSDSIKTASCK